MMALATVLAIYESARTGLPVNVPDYLRAPESAPPLRSSTTMTIADDLRLALIQADPRLSKFNPLPRILFYDDFDEGVHGWAELIGNHDGNLDNIRPIMADLRPPQLSSCTFFDIGTHGSVHGTYALKLATRAKANHMAQLIKRLTFVRQGLVQFETYFTYKAEQIFSRAKGDAAVWDGNFDPSETDFGDFTISNDVCEGHEGTRYHCALRYLTPMSTASWCRSGCTRPRCRPPPRCIAPASPRPP